MADLRADVYRRLRTILGDCLGVEEDEITLDTHVFEDLNADVLEFHDEVIPLIEEEFDIQIPNEDLADLTTVRELVSYIVENI